MPPELGRIDIQLNDGRARPRHLPPGRNLAASVAADIEHEVRGQHAAIGALSRVSAHDSDVERMVAREKLLGVQRRGDRNRQPFCQLAQLGAGV